MQKLDSSEMPQSGEGKVVKKAVIMLTKIYVHKYAYYVGSELESTSFKAMLTMLLREIRPAENDNASSIVQQILAYLRQGFSAFDTATSSRIPAKIVFILILDELRLILQQKLACYRWIYPACEFYIYTGVCKLWSKYNWTNTSQFM